MKRMFAILLGALLFGLAFAVELPANGEFVLVSEGSVVGVGEFNDGNLELELLAGFTGFATLTIVDEFGNEITAEVMIGGDSSVVLSETLEDLGDLVARDGGEVEVRVEEEVEAEGNAAFGAAVPDHVELPQVAVEGMEEAEENAAEARERAQEARSESDENRAEGEANAEGRAEGRVDVRGGQPDDADERGDEDEDESGGSAEVGGEVSTEIGVEVGNDRSDR